MNVEGVKIFRSKISLPIVLPLMTFMVGDFVFEIFQSRARIISYPGLACVMLAATIAFFIWLGFTRYEVTAENLKVICGPFRWQYALSDIVEVEPTRSMFTAPALSLDRLEVKFRTGSSVVVSPVRKTDFLLAIGRQ